MTVLGYLRHAGMGDAGQLLRSCGRGWQDELGELIDAGLVEPFKTRAHPSIISDARCGYVHQPEIKPTLFYRLVERGGAPAESSAAHTQPRQGIETTPEDAE